MEKLYKSAGEWYPWPPVSSQERLSFAAGSLIYPSTVAIITSVVPWDHSLKNSDNFLFFLLSSSFFSRATTHTMPFCNLFSFAEENLPCSSWLGFYGLAILVLDGLELFLPQSWHGLVMPAGERQHTCGCARLGLGGGWTRVTQGLPAWLHPLTFTRLSELYGEAQGVCAAAPAPVGVVYLTCGSPSFLASSGHLYSGSGHSQISGL